MRNIYLKALDAEKGVKQFRSVMITSEYSRSTIFGTYLTLLLPCCVNTRMRKIVVLLFKPFTTQFLPLSNLLPRPSVFLIGLSFVHNSPTYLPVKYSNHQFVYTPKMEVLDWSCLEKKFADDNVETNYPVIIVRKT